MLRVIILTLGLILLLGSSYILADEKPNISKIADQPKLSKKLPNETQLDKLRELGDDVKIEWNRENGTPLFLYGSLAKSTNGITAERASNNFLDEHKALFKLEIPEKDLKIHSLETDQIGYTHVKYDQYIDDVPIWGSQLGIHINPGREVYAVSGNYHPSIDMSTMPSIADSQAMTIAIKDFNINDPRQVDGRAKLVVFPWKDEYHLCWHIEIYSKMYADIYWQYFIDALSGEVIFKYNDIHFDGPAEGWGLSQDGYYYPINTYFLYGIYTLIDASQYMYAPPINVLNGVIITKDADYDTLDDPAFNPIFITDLNGDNTFDELTRYYSAVDAHINFGIVYDYYLSVFGRNSWNGLGNSIISNVHYGENYRNAFWNGIYQQFYFGDGLYPIEWGYTYALDIVTHEFTHAVTQTSAGLIYLGQPGALNESMSDVFACMLDSTDWTIGESMVWPYPYYCRNMENPHLGYPPDQFYFGHQPMVMSEYQYKPYDDDHGGVHANNGIPNHAAYLIASIIGRPKTAQIYYRALTQYLGPTSIFLNAYWDIWSSSIDLYGIGNEMAAVEYAFDSVGIMPDANEWNLYADDGVPEFITWWEEVNRGLAAEFYLPGNIKIESISYYIAEDNAGGNGDFYIKLFEDSLDMPKNEPKYSFTTDITISLGGWISFDLSEYNLYFSDKMYVGMFYDGINQPMLGMDTSSQWQSWFYNGMEWISDSAIYFIRALVTTSTYICGDANSDETANVSDAVFLINYVFLEGPPPEPLCKGDANKDSKTNVSDAVWIINYVFLEGDPPEPNCCDPLW